MVYSSHILRRFPRLRPIILPATVFLTGACVLVIEVVATRILSPYYGNTIFSYSSIIGVVLAALSIGYYAGGRIADKLPSAKVFFAIIAAGGLSVIFLQYLSASLLPVLGRSLPITTGPLFSSLALFLTPALLLGTLSPFAIKLQERLAKDKGIGTIAGEMFFWSTLGSIAGSLATGFILVPFLGIDTIVVGIGIILILLGSVPLFLLGVRPRSGKAKLIIIMSVLFIIIAGSSSAEADNSYVYRKDGVYEKISIFDGSYGGRPTRFFNQDATTSGAMFLNSDDLVYDYTKYYSLFKLTKPDTRNALVIGGGAYSIPKALLKDLPKAKITVSEIEPSLPALAKKYFRLPDDPRLSHSGQDGRRLLSGNDNKYDYIYSDVYYSLYSIPAHFTTQEFFKLANDRLSQDGIFIANMIGSTAAQKPSFILSEMRTFRTAFPNSYFFAVNSASSDDTQNIIFVGLKGDKKLDLNSDAILHNADPIIAGLAGKQIEPARYDLAAHPILTDNYAPVEYLITPLLANANKPAGSRANGDDMMDSIRRQMSFGPRYPSAPGHMAVQQYIQDTARQQTPDVSFQRWQETDDQTKKVHDLANIIVRLNPKADRRIIVGAHYDTKFSANLDKQDSNAPMPGANDGGSGVAVLLETIKVLAANPPDVGIDFVFFDGEEGFERQDIDTNGWRPLGADYFSNHLVDTYKDGLPANGVIVDMVCKKDLNLIREANSIRSAPRQVQAFWQIGRSISPSDFSDQRPTTIYDDHIPLIRAGIPSFDVIDLDYPEWHTRQDTTDKCSPHSLKAVADTLITYLRQY